VPDTAAINLHLKNENEGVAITLDGQIGYQMKTGDTVSIRKSPTNFNLVSRRIEIISTFCETN
jgi:NAD kinase